MTFSFIFDKIKRNGYDIMKILENLNIKIKNEKLLERALTHSSYANEHQTKDYERLEFLGDAILGAVIGKYLYLNTNLDEGKMSKLRANYVCEKALATYVRDLGIDKHIRLGNGIKNNLNDTIAADVFEAITAAIYLDLGHDEAEKFLLKVIVPYIKEGNDFNTDYKTKLQEAVQTEKKTVEYVLTREYGNSHDKTFEIDVVVDGIIYGHGIGKSKKEAEQKAAFSALCKSAVKKCI